MKKLFVSALLVAIAGAGLAAYVIDGRTRAPFRGWSGTEQFVEVPVGAGTKGIGDRLIAAGVVRDPITYRVALWLSGDARRLKAGEYRFDHAMTALEVLGTIARGEVYVMSITFPEGLTVAEMSHVFETHGFGPAASFVAAARDRSALAGPGLDGLRGLDLLGPPSAGAPDLEGYLFPDTYAVPRKTDAPTLVHLMLERFARVLTPELREAATARGWSIRQLATLASIVEKETARAEERPLVAAVYVNRLKMGMGLQCDPTVIYALAQAGRYTGNLRRDDLAFDSPYNTYRYPGLPPGPIAAPGKGALDAAAHPADVDYVYFVSRNDGTHAFARTLEEHNANVRKYQVVYFREKRERDRAAGH